ncbi:MAG TPA: type II secretion system F family protein [Gaiellaceae bacterium]
MRRALAAVCLLAAIVPAAAAAATATRITTVDTSGYPTVRATVVTPRPVAKLPALTENGNKVAGYEAANLGRQKSVILAVDRSQSMLGKALADATGAARAFIRTKPRSDRVAIVAVGKSVVQLTSFSSLTNEADTALRTLEVDPVRGTALYDAVVLSTQALASDVHATRVLVLLTDGQEVSSEASLSEAIEAAREAKVAVYPIAIESPSFKPAPLKRLAAETGGRYAGAASSGSLPAIYAALAAELRRTWTVSYLTNARPGDQIELAVGKARLETTVPGQSAAAAGDKSSLPGPLFSVGPALIATLVGGCVLLATLLLFRAPAGTGLKRRIAPHLGERQSKRSRGQVQERFATASTIMRATEQALGHLRVWHSLHKLLERADLPLRTVELVYAAVGSALTLSIILAIAGLGPIFIIIAMGVGGSIPILIVWWKARRRLNAIDDQLPDLLVTLAASLKAGHSFRQGIQAVVDEGQPPASKEFKRVLTETRLGRPMDHALADMAERVGSKNLTFVVTAVTIQRQVGGSLAGIFDMVADAVRNRQQFARKIKSLTAMGRMSAYVLVGVPFFMLASITLLNRQYMSPLYHTGTGQKLLMLGVVMITIGSLLLRKIVAFKG